MNTKIMYLGTVVFLICASPLYGAVTTLSGGVSTGYEYFDRTYKNSDSATSSSSDDDDSSRFRISPFVTIVNETPRQSAEFRYAPSFWYDLDQSESDVDHSLSLDYMRALTQHWSFTFSDNLSVSDEFNSYSPTTDPKTGQIISGSPGADAAGDTLKDERGRRRYTNNSASFGTSYMYLEDSTVALDYTYTILRNESDYSGDNYQDYDKHDVAFTVAHRLNSQWKATAVAGYIRGLYDNVGEGESTAITTGDDDLHEYRTSLLLDYLLSVQHSLSGVYSYDQTDYDSDLQQDSEIHNVTFGWGWNISPKLSMNLGAGPTYSKQDGASGDWSSNENFGLKYRLEKGNVGLTASHGTSFDNFDGTDDRGTTEYWQMQSNVGYALYQYTNIRAYMGYRKDDSSDTGTVGLADTGSADTETYSAGCGISYRFDENYVADLSYGYVHNISDNADDEYDDNRIVMSVSYNNDFLQW